MTIGGILITDFETSYKNNYYHSVFDTPDNLKIDLPPNITEIDASQYTTKFGQRLQKVITSLAQSIYSVSTGSVLSDQADQKTINQLVYCFYRNATCDFFSTVMTRNQWRSYLKQLNSTLPYNQLSFYTSVNDGFITGKFISQILLRYFTRNVLFENLNSTECNKNSDSVKNLIRTSNVSIADLVFVNNSTCVASAVYGVSSVSPAFDRSDDGLLVDTDKFSAWTESSWPGDSVQMRLFIFTNDALQISTFVVGACTCILSIIIGIIVNKYSNRFSFFGDSDQNIEIIQ